MECSQIPAAEKWDQLPQSQLEQFRSHLKSCPRCRKRFTREAPDILLFEIQETALPEDFWLGFWDSVHAKIQQKKITTPFPVLRWAAVFVVGLLLISFSHNVEKSPVAKSLPVRQFAPESFKYPLVENLKNPKATYYIFEPDKNEKIVMILDPDMDL